METVLMNLLLILDDYLPNSTRVSAKMMHEMALELKNMGHEVYVLTPGVSSQSDILVKDQLDGIHVWRFRSGALKDIPRAQRLVNESLLSFRAWRAIKPELADLKIDGIVYYSPSIFFGGVVSKLKRHFSCKTYLVLRDLFPQWAIDEGMISPTSLITKYLQFFEKKSYAAADSIGLMSEKNVEVFKRLQPDLNNLSVLRNWVSVSPSLGKQPYWRNKLGLQNKIIFLYGGNIGKAQDMPNLLRLAKSLKNIDDAHVLFVGQGESFDDVKDYIEVQPLENATLLPSITQEEFKDLLREVDIGLFSLAKTHTAHNFPGKILGYIANSLPILGSVNPGNDLMTVVNQHQAGLVFENGNDEALHDAAQKLARSETLRTELGENARKLLDSHFSVQSAASRVIDKLQVMH